MNFGEVFDDFEHKDFTAKNVRVRPISGFTHGDEGGAVGEFGKFSGFDGKVAIADTGG